mmetsp:Transcript_110086/g.215798  ORF Transcript_110086/g.215798 Transcript_110086/m.215798 type:complete len:103 (-) Transcript_110086:913-1221(-)
MRRVEFKPCLGTSTPSAVMLSTNSFTSSIDCAGRSFLFSLLPSGLVLWAAKKKSTQVKQHVKIQDENRQEKTEEVECREQIMHCHTLLSRLGWLREEQQSPL